MLRDIYNMARRGALDELTGIYVHLIINGQHCMRKTARSGNGHEIAVVFRKSEKKKKAKKVKINEKVLINEKRC